MHARLLLSRVNRCNPISHAILSMAAIDTNFVAQLDELRPILATITVERGPGASRGGPFVRLNLIGKNGIEPEMNTRVEVCFTVVPEKPGSREYSRICRGIYPPERT